MAQQTFEEIAAAVKQAESGGKRYAADGKTLTTSAKGALGEMQVMPKTSRDPGFGVVPVRDQSPDEIARVGRDYLQAMMGKYGNMEKALVAYNMGPGSTDKWIAAGAKLEKLPDETRTYVQRVKGFLGNSVSRETKQPVKEKAKSAESLPSLPPMAAAPALSMKEQMSSLGPGYQAALALSFLSDTDDKEDRDTEKEPGIAEQFMADTASRPSAMAQFADFKIQSPFAESAKPQMLADGGIVYRAGGSPEEGERLTPQQMERLAAQETAEREEAAKPMFGLALTPKSGIGRKEGPISQALNSGEAYVNMAKGLTEMPYNLAGAPMDLIMLARQALTGRAPEGQVGTSDYIKKKMTELGIRPAPPTDPTAKGFYTAGDLLSNVVNPAGVTRAGVKTAQATETVAKDMLSAFKKPKEVPQIAPAAQIRPADALPAPIQQAAQLPPPPAAVNVPPEVQLPPPTVTELPVAIPVAPPMQAAVPADRPFVGRLDSFIDTLKGPVQLGQLKGQLKGKFRDYDLERVERAFSGMDAKTKLTPDQIKQALAENYSPSKWLSETLPPKAGAYHQSVDNVWGAPLGTTNLYLQQSPEALQANDLLREAVQVFTPFLKRTTSSTPTIENLTQARTLLTNPELLKVVDPELIKNLSKTFDKVEKNVGLVKEYSEAIGNVSNGFAYPVLYVDRVASIGNPTGSIQPFFKFAQEAHNAERAALEQRFLAEGLDLRAANSRVDKEMLDNFQLYYQKTQKIASQKVQELAIAEAQKNGINLPDVSLINWDELSNVTQPMTNPAFKQSLENALEPSRVTVNEATKNIKNVLDPEIKKVGDVLYQRGYLYEGRHSGVAGKPYPISFTRFSEHQSTIPGAGTVQGRHFHELQSDLSKDMRKSGTTAGSEAKDQLEYNRLRGEVQQAQQKTMDKLQELQNQKRALVNEGAPEASFKKIEKEEEAARDALSTSTRAMEKRISTLGNRIREKPSYSLQEPFAGFETNQMVRQQLLMKNAIQSAMRDGKGFATFPGAESTQPTLYVGKVQPNLKQVIKDLGGEKSGLELRQIELSPDKDGNPITAWGVVWSPETAARIVEKGVPFAKGGMVERQSPDNRRYL